MGIDFVKNMGSTAVWSIQSAGIAGFSGFCLGKIFSKADPASSAAFASRTAGYSLAVGLGLGALHDALIDSDYSGLIKKEREFNESLDKGRKFVVITVGALSTAAVSYFYHKEFPLISAISYVFIGALGSVGTFAVKDYLPESAMVPAWAIQSGCVAGITGLFTAELFDQIGSAKVVEFASRTAGLGVAVGLGVGLFCNSLAKWVSGDKKAELKETHVLMVLSGAATACASSLYHKEFPLVAAITYTFIGALGSVGVYTLVDSMTSDRPQKGSARRKKKEMKLENQEKNKNKVSFFTTLWASMKKMFKKGNEEKK